MMKPMNILLAVDDSEASLHACRLVAAYAGDRSNLRITLLNVQRPPLRLFPDAGVDHAVLEEALREQGDGELAPGRALLVASGYQPESLVRVGPPADTILEVARQCDARVLVMGSGRHGPLGGYAMGSVALRVAPGAACPVVLVKPGVQLPAEPGLRLRVAAPVDGSPESVQAVRRLVECAGLLGSLHVDLVHFRPGLSLAAAILPPHDDVLQEWGGRQSEAAVDVPAKMLADAGIPHEVHRLTGAAKTDIAVFARRQGAELVAMGTRGTGAMHHLLVGSAALKTALASDVPVAFMR
jgi:nucleotide-binding universal stress UspA family protein